MKNTNSALTTGKKFAPVAVAMGALILGCSAFMWVQPEVYQFSKSTLAELPTPRSIVAKIGFAFPSIASAGARTCAAFIGPIKRAPLAIADVLALIRVSAGKHNVPPAFVRSIVAAESNFNSEALSPKGAIGLMQLMPETAKEYGANPTQPDQNIDAGTHYLRVLMDRYRKYRNSLTLVTAAYNAGPGMVDKYRGVPPFRETRGYVVRVRDFLHRFTAESNNIPASITVTRR